MKIVAFTDKKGSAIDRIARMNERRLPHLNYRVLSFHPKRASQEEIADAKRAIEEADMFDGQYWKSAVAIRNYFPEANEKPWILNHHNEHNINDDGRNHWEWKDMKWAVHVCKNGWQKAELKKQRIDAVLIRHAVEFEHFSFAPTLTTEKVVGYVGQVKKNKGVREIAQACQELGYKLLIAGSVSEMDYYQDLMRRFGDTIVTLIPGTFAAPDNLIGTVYHKMRVYCANSDDGTESGTMPILEAMASGIPVVARKIGLVRDCGEHKKNMWVNTAKYTDIVALKAALRMVMENTDIADDLRESAWRTVRQYHPDIHARESERVYRRLMGGKELSVSVIMPTCGRNDVIEQNILALRDQVYKNFEVVVCDDNLSDESAALEEVIRGLRGKVQFPIKHVWTRKHGSAFYGLAKARNMGLIEATGEVVVFCDDRLKMHPHAIGSFVRVLTDLAGPELRSRKAWIWGSKGGFKTFVENFSATWRRSVIDGGMFCERVDEYGGMTQEVSGRFGAQGFRFEFCPQALCEPMLKTHSKSRHREEIIRSKVKLYKMGFQ